MRRTEWRAAAALAGAAALTAGCAEQGYSVIATSATSIGLEIGQAPAAQTPRFVLGYSRAEHAFVPTNRPSNAKTADASEGVAGADDSADVLMELRYGGGAGAQVDTSIYQRLAVGRTAVSQRGAALLFAKGPDGRIDPQAAEVAALAEGMAASRASAEGAMLACISSEGTGIDAARRDALIAEALATDDRLSPGLYARLGAAETPGAALDAMRALPVNTLDALGEAAEDC